MKTNSVSQIIRLRTAAHFGSAIGPHLMRHIIGTAVAEHTPDRGMDVPSILGHASMEASERHYIHAGQFKRLGGIRPGFFRAVARSAREDASAQIGELAAGA